jgi:flagellar export protein FliJ
MAFVFNLQGPLRVRELQEQAALQVLLTIAAQVSLTRAAIVSIDDCVAADRQEVQARSAVGVTGAEWQFLAARQQVLMHRRRVLTNRLQEQERAREKQQARYLLARQQREILSSLQEQQRAAYVLEQSRRTQRQLDELFLMRRAASREE